MNKNDIGMMITLLKSDKVLALPTESVYGLSVRLESQAVAKIVTLKKRSANKGFIVLSSKIEHLLHVTDVKHLNNEDLARLRGKKVRATTWIVPVNPEFQWITGSFDTIAVRLTTHPLLSLLTQSLNQAIISTSANISGHPPATSASEVYNYFGENVDYIYPNNDFIAKKPSRLVNLITGEILRN